MALVRQHEPARQPSAVTASKLHIQLPIIVECIRQCFTQAITATFFACLAIIDHCCLLEVSRLDKVLRPFSRLAWRQLPCIASTIWNVLDTKGVTKERECLFHSH